jgi:hypothetical protein
MLMIIRVIFHFICSIGRFFRKIFQLILGRRHEELGTSVSKTEPVTLEDIRIIGEMENDSNRPYQSFTSVPKVLKKNRIIIFFNYLFNYSYHKHNGIHGVLMISFDIQQQTKMMNESIILLTLQQQLKKHLK